MFEDFKHFLKLKTTLHRKQNVTGRYSGSVVLKNEWSQRLTHALAQQYNGTKEKCHYPSKTWIDLSMGWHTLQDTKKTINTTQDESGFAAPVDRVVASATPWQQVYRLEDLNCTVLYCTVERHRFWPWLNLQIMWILMPKGFEREGIIIKKYLISKGRPVTHWKGALVLNFSMRKQNWVTHVLIVTRYQRRGNREYIVLFHVHVFLANYFFLCRKSEDFRLISLKVFRKFWATL